MSHAICSFLCFRPSARATALKDAFRSVFVNVLCNLLMFVFSPLRRAAALKDTVRYVFVNVLSNVLVLVFSPLRQGGGLERHFSVCFCECPMQSAHFRVFAPSTRAAALKDTFRYVFVNVVCNLVIFVFRPARQGGGLERHVSVCVCECLMQCARFCVFAPPPGRRP